MLISVRSARIYGYRVPNLRHCDWKGKRSIVAEETWEENIVSLYLPVLVLDR